MPLLILIATAACREHLISQHFARELGTMANACMDGASPAREGELKRPCKQHHRVWASEWVGGWVGGSVGWDLRFAWTLVKCFACTCVCANRRYLPAPNDSWRRERSILLMHMYPRAQTVFKWFAALPPLPFCPGLIMWRDSRSLLVTDRWMRFS